MAENTLVFVDMNTFRSKNRRIVVTHGLPKPAAPGPLVLLDQAEAALDFVASWEMARIEEISRLFGLEMEAASILYDHIHLS